MDNCKILGLLSFILMDKCKFQQLLTDIDGRVDGHGESVVDAVIRDESDVADAVVVHERRQEVKAANRLKVKNEASFKPGS